MKSLNEMTLYEIKELMAEYSNRGIDFYFTFWHFSPKTKTIVIYPCEMNEASGEVRLDMPAREEIEIVLCELGREAASTIREMAERVEMRAAKNEKIIRGLITTVEATEVSSDV